MVEGSIPRCSGAGTGRLFCQETVKQGRSLLKVLAKEVILPLVPNSIVWGMRPKSIKDLYPCRDAMSPYISSTLDVAFRTAGLGGPQPHPTPSSVKDAQLQMLRKGHLTWRRAADL